MKMTKRIRHSDFPHLHSERKAKCGGKISSNSKKIEILLKEMAVKTNDF